MIVCVENSKKAAQSLELISEFSKFIGFKVNIQNQLYFYTLAMNNQKILKLPWKMENIKY